MELYLNLYFHLPTTSATLIWHNFFGYSFFFRESVVQVGLFSYRFYCPCLVFHLHKKTKTTDNNLGTINKKLVQFTMNETKTTTFDSFLSSTLAVIQQLGETLKLRQQVIATATTFLKRFYARNSLRCIDPLLLAPTSVFLSSKVEEFGVISNSRLISTCQTVGEWVILVYIYLFILFLFILKGYWLRDNKNM